MHKQDSVLTNQQWLIAIKTNQTIFIQTNIQVTPFVEWMLKVMIRFFA